MIDLDQGDESMGLIEDVSKTLVQSFASLDDLGLAQELFSGGLSEVASSGRSVAGFIPISSSLMARAFLIPVQAGAKTTKVTAEVFTGTVPGADFVQMLAENIDVKAASMGEEASQLALHAVELARGGESMPLNPLTEEPWLNKSIRPGYTWGDLTADMVIGLFGQVATLPVSFGLETAMSMTSSEMGRRVTEPTLQSMNALLDVPGINATQFDTNEIRESFMAVVCSSAGSTMRHVVDLTAGATRFTFGDTKKLALVLEEALEEMRRLSRDGDLDDFLPAVPILATIRERARSGVEHTPDKFLQALKEKPEGQIPQTGVILDAIFEDSHNLRLFLADYLQVQTLMGVYFSTLLAIGTMDISKLETYVQDDSPDTTDSHKLRSGSLFESCLGRLATGTNGESQGLVSQAAIDMIQDIVFSYSSDIIGREKAISRVARLYGNKVLGRLENDISLDLDILRTNQLKERDVKLRDYIDSVSDSRALTKQIEYCEEKRDSLQSFTSSLFNYQTTTIKRREDTLRTFISLALQDLALRDMKSTEKTERQQALQSFDTWIDYEMRS